MKPLFKGFKGNNSNEQVTARRNPHSTSEQSEYDSTVSSRDSSREGSPSGFLTQGANTVQRSNQESRSLVRRLVDQFSNSDSDTTDKSSYTTRRKKSKTLQHTELPVGGERELRKKMATQTQAEEAIKVWKALVALLKTTLDEADQAIDVNSSRTLLVGHKAGIVALEDDLVKAWESVESFVDKPDIVIDKVALIVLKNKARSRCHKVKGQIEALTEREVKTGSTSMIQVVNPTSFGDLVLPEFHGDYTEYESFECNFKSIIDNGKLDDGAKRSYLLDKLKGEARDYIGSDGLASKSYDDIWLELKQRFGKPWRVTRAAVKKLMDIPDPVETPSDITRYWNQLIETCKIVERRKLTATAVILNMGLLKVPVDFRAKMDDKLKPLSLEYNLSRDIIAEPFNDVIAGEIERPSNKVATLGFNTVPQQLPNAQRSNTKSSGHPNQKKKTKFFTCLLCGKKKQTHKTWQCPTYNTGPLARDRMMKLGRCGKCAVPMNEHGNDCSHRAYCSEHPGQRHVFWLCAKYTNITYHPNQQPAAHQNSWPQQNSWSQQQNSWPQQQNSWSQQQSPRPQNQQYNQGQGQYSGMSQHNYGNQHQYPKGPQSGNPQP